jgi:hypothetical protein
MRFIITAGPNPNATPQADEEFDEKLFAAYMKFNEDMAQAGVLVSSEGLNPAGARAQVAVVGGKRTVMDGPFSESKELVGGFYLIEVDSKEEAIEWAMRCPVGMRTADVLEIHQMTGAEDIPPHLLEIAARVAPTWTASFGKRSGQH